MIRLIGIDVDGTLLDMLEYAGLPVVMGNAVPVLRTRGWHVTGHQDEAGLAGAIARFVLDRR